MENSKPGKNEDRVEMLTTDDNLLKDIYSLWPTHPMTKLKTQGEVHTHSLEDINHTG